MHLDVDTPPPPPRVKVWMLEEGASVPVNMDIVVCEQEQISVCAHAWVGGGVWVGGWVGVHAIWSIILQGSPDICVTSCNGRDIHMHTLTWLN